MNEYLKITLEVLGFILVLLSLCSGGVYGLMVTGFLAVIGSPILYALSRDHVSSVAIFASGLLAFLPTAYLHSSAGKERRSNRRPTPAPTDDDPPAAA